MKIKVGVVVVVRDDGHGVAIQRVPGGCRTVGDKIQMVLVLTARVGARVVDHPQPKNIVAGERKCSEP